MDKNKVMKLIAGNLAFASGMVVAFSPGLLGLSVFDPSIIKAALSLTLGVLLPAGMVSYNYKLLREKKEPVLFIEGTTMSVEDMRKEMVKFEHSAIFGNIVRDSLKQLEKCQELRVSVEEILGRKFDIGSLTYQKFYGIADSAQKAIISNMIAMVNRMRVINDDEYIKLLNYQKDDIPDEIQIPRLELYKKNIEAVKNQRNQNEGLLYKLDELLLELTASEIVDATKCKAYMEIDSLIKQIQYYE